MKKKQENNPNEENNNQENNVPESNAGNGSRNHAEEIQTLQTEVDEFKKQSQEFFEGWQRERADFMNYKKRIERDQTAMKNYMSSELIKKYLVVIDDMELALKNQPQSQECANWVNGVNLIYQKLISILESEGVERIATQGEFDPNIHEALTQVESTEHEAGQIVEVMRNGYRLGDRILRPALVIVAH